VVKSLVDKTSTLKGLKVFSIIKDKIYETGRKVSETFKENMKIVFDKYLGKLNYKAIPKVKT
jgi:Rhodopirellula transposase DDE domain